MSYRPPYYKMYPQDFLSSPTTRMMTLAEKGLYKHLLDHAWLEEITATLPADLGILSKLVGVDKRTLRKFTVKFPQVFRTLTEDSQRVYNPRQMAEYQEFLQTVDKNRLAGLASGKARQSKGTPVQHPLNHKELDTEVREEKRKPAAKPAQPPDSRFQPFFEYAYESYRAKHGQPPIWTGKDKNGLKTLLRGAPITVLPLERLTGLWDNFAASTEPFTAKQGDSLAYFCSNLDKFSSGPILEGGSNGKLVSFAEKRSQKNADAIQSVLGRAEEASGDIRRALPPAHN